MHAVTLTFSRHHLLEPGGGHTLGSPTGPGLILHQHSSNVDGVGVHLKKRERERERGCKQEGIIFTQAYKRKNSVTPACQIHRVKKITKESKFPDDVSRNEYSESCL